MGIFTFGVRRGLASVKLLARKARKDLKVFKGPKVLTALPEVKDL
jgi:hypothetical protein